MVIIIKALYIFLIFFPFIVIKIIEKKIVSKKALPLLYLIIAGAIFFFYRNIETLYLSNYEQVYNFLAILAFALFPLMKIYAPYNSMDKDMNITNIIRLMEIFLFFILSPLITIMILVHQLDSSWYFLAQTMTILTILFLLPFVLYLKLKELITGRY